MQGRKCCLLGTDTSTRDVGSSRPSSYSLEKPWILGVTNTQNEIEGRSYSCLTNFSNMLQ